MNQELRSLRRRNGSPHLTRTDPFTKNVGRVEYAKLSIEELAKEAISASQNGTIGVEIPVKDGKLGKVKRLHIVFQSD